MRYVRRLVFLALSLLSAFRTLHSRRPFETDRVESFVGRVDPKSGQSDHKRKFNNSIEGRKVWLDRDLIDLR